MPASSSPSLERELTAGDVRLDYRRHVITRDDAFDRLLDLGYTPNEAKLLLKIVNTLHRDRDREERHERH